MSLSALQKTLFTLSSDDFLLQNLSNPAVGTGPWDSERARFRPWAVPYLAALPLVVAGLALAIYLLRLVLPRAPQWATVFVHETDREAKLEGENSPQPYNIRLILVTAISLVGLILHSITWSRSIGQVPLALSSVSWLCAAAIGLVFRPRVFSWTLLILYTSIFLVEFVSFVDRISRPDASDIPEILELLSAFCGAIVVISMPLRPSDWSKDGISKPFEKPDPSLRSPEDDLTAWEWMSVSWLKPLLVLGRKRQLNEEDVWFLGLEFHHRRLHDAFRDLYGSVLRRLLLTNGLDLFITSLLGILECVANAASPIFLQQILLSLEDPEASRSVPLTYALLSLAARLIAAQSGVFSLWYCRRCYERSRGEMITMLYEKTLSRKIMSEEGDKSVDQPPEDQANGSAQEDAQHQVKAASRSWLPEFLRHKPASKPIEQPDKKPATMGKILNLMKNDVYEVSQRFWEFRDLVTTPLQLIITVALIWAMLGWPCLIGISTVVFTQALTVLLARVLMIWEKKRRQATDRKLQIVSQFIEAIRHLRWYGWQGAWLEQIHERRQQELNLLIVTRLLQHLITAMTQYGISLFPALSFYAYTVLFEQKLTVDVAFPALQLFLMLSMTMRRLPDLITMVLNGAVALGRIEAFMGEPDKEEPQQPVILDRQPNLDEATFAWPGSGKIALKNVTLGFPTGMTVIGGKVGCGKTALLLALLGELDLVGGTYRRSSDSIGYCEQRPWLQSMTIRDNILFHTPYDEIRYKQVLDVCALTPDLAGFQSGDLSYIGENGIGLSGGQRARVALARAVYSHAKILMLDDPLSALDHQTAESVVNRCLNGPLMAGRTLILVTHRLDACRGVATQYIEIQDGAASVRPVSELPSYADEPSRPKDGGEEEGTNEQQAKDAVPEKFTEDEHRAHGGIEYSVYWEYIKAARYRWWILLVLCFILMRCFSIAKSWFLKTWGEAYDRGDIRADGFDNFFDDWPPPETDPGKWILVYTLLVLAHCTTLLVARAFSFIIVYTAGRNLFRAVIQHVAHATFRFYDVTPVGRLMNRMTSDMANVDGDISRQFHELAIWGVEWISGMIVIAAVTPLFLVFALGMTAAFIIVFMQFLPTSQSLRRLEMTSLSPLISDFGALLDGLTTVRAFRMQSKFQDRVIAVTDNFQRMDHFYWSAQSWLMYRFDAISGISTFLLTAIAIFSNISPGLIAFALTVAAQFVFATHALCQCYGKLQMDFVSVERVVELIRLDQEPEGDFEPPASWPRYSGDIVFDNVGIRYAPHMDPAVSGVSFTIKGGTTTAVIGRTGSGKSTLAAALLATVLPDTGSITIDGVDISRVSKQTLRSRLTFLAQDPVLFPGTLRQNLDPIKEHTDEDCERVLQKVCGTHEWTLETHVDGGGRNFSQGQRQLIGLARAILRRSAVVILDEATASIDIGTSMQIQDVLREEMKESTVVTIAHRVEAVKDADSVIVLDNGRLSEHRSVASSS